MFDPTSNAIAAIDTFRSKSYVYRVPLQRQQTQAQAHDRTARRAASLRNAQDGQRLPART